MQQTSNALRGLVVDIINKAGGGHPGGAMSSMDLVATLYSGFLKFDPDDPKWLGRDRFILSAGHESAMLYAILHYVGWLSTADLKGFRQLGSKTPGHPEVGVTPGVECTTGPLGLGAAMSVGFSISSLHLAETLDKDLFSSNTWSLLGDGCMQEGVTLSAASLAGHLGLSNLIWIYDKNAVQITGPIDTVTSDDTEKIFDGFGWNVIEIDGHNQREIEEAYSTARQESKKPTLIIANTVIAKGAPSLEGSAAAHGTPITGNERLETKKNLGLPHDKDFFIPPECRNTFRKNYASLRDEVSGWKRKLEERMNTKQFSEKYRLIFERTDFSNLTSIDWPKENMVATRGAFGKLIEKWADELPNLLGGSADLAVSNMTSAFGEKVGDFTKSSRSGRNINYGVREFPMAAICNGIALAGGLIPFGATYLTFADYCRGAIRLGALQKARVIHEFTHDSFHVGEDGPTHQAVEQIMSLRIIPNLNVMRPADAQETEVLLKAALNLDTPTAFCLSRQKLPLLNLSTETISSAKKGGYIVREEKDPELIIVAAGSEVSLALEVAEDLKMRVRVVSMPCWELFEKQSVEYRENTLPKSCTMRVSIEAGTTMGWQKFTGQYGLNIGIDHFGESAPAKQLTEHYKFTRYDIVAKISKHNFA